MDVVNARPDITSLIKTVSEEHGIRNYLITDVQTNEKGEGYLGQIFMVTVKDKNDDKHMEMVIKAAFTDEKVRQVVPIRMSFENEIYFYKNLLPTFENMEEERGITEVVPFVPKCFGVSMEEGKEMLALENLKCSGFEVTDKTKIMDEDHVRLIFQTYGRLHGYSFALRDQKPEEYARITKDIVNPMESMVESDFFRQLLMEINNLVQNSFVPEKDGEIMKKYENYAGDNILTIFLDVVKAKSEYSVLLHGDCWSNNMLFKYEEHQGGRKPTEIRLIDWQIIKVGTPVFDLSYSLYSGASKKVFDKLDELLRVYHDSFSSLVKSLGSDPGKLFSFSTLKDEWKKYSKFGMIMAFQMIKMKLTSKEDIVDLTDADKYDLSDMSKLKDVLVKQKFEEENYKMRIRELIYHMSEIDAL